MGYAEWHGQVTDKDSFVCGIVGIAGPALSNEERRRAVRQMANSIVHRGPDDEGFYDSDSVTIGMRRLSIIDVAGGHQPIANEDKSIWTVCNGEIYNFRELRNRLENRGHHFRSNSDAEVIVHLYEEHGSAFVNHLSGMFAIALWDNNESTLFVVRDHLGIKPVYYQETGESFRFASEIKSLMAVPGFEASMDREALLGYLSLGYSVAPRTIFSGVRKLPPAARLKWQRGDLSIDEYWSVPRAVRTDLNEKDWISATEQQLRRSVKAHMVSDVPIGAFLSGGVDSSAVVALMAEQNPEPVNTYSIGYSGSKAAAYYNELPHAARVAEQFKTNHHEIAVEPDVATLLPRLIWHLEEPISDSAIATTYLVAELAAQSVKVILSGVGGDELFAGYNRYLGDHYGRLYQRLPLWLRQRVLRGLVDYLPSGRQSRFLDLSRYAKSFVKSASLPWSDQYKLYLALAEQQVLDGLVKGGPLTGDDGFDRILSNEGSSDPLLRLLRVDWKAQLSEDLLLLTDKMSMAESLECRVPFLDHELVEFAAEMPTHIKRPGRQLKYVLKEALRSLLPPEILDRRKRGFGAPVGAWFQGELQVLRDYLLSTSSVQERGWLTPDYVASICRDHDEHKQDYTDLILVMMNLEIWARLFIDGKEPDQVGCELAEVVGATR